MKTHKISNWISSCYPLRFQVILLWLIFLLPGCTQTSSLQSYENPEAGISLEKPVAWDMAYYKRNGQILLEDENGFWHKDSVLVEIHGKSCLSDSSADRPDLKKEIERIRNLYDLDSVTIIQEPTVLETGDYEVNKAVIVIPAIKMQGDDHRIRVGDSGPDLFQTIELYAIWTRGRHIWAYIYEGDDDRLNAQAQEIIDSIQFTCKD